MSYLTNNPKLADSIESLHSVAANFGKVFYLPVLDPHNVQDDFIEFFDDLDDYNVESLNEQYAGFQEIADSYEKCSRNDRRDFFCEFISELHQKCEFPMLVEVRLCQTISSVTLDKNQEPVGFGGAWNSYHSNWILVENWEQAIEKGITLGKQNLLEHHKLKTA